jgi:hypothetical protein
VSCFAVAEEISALDQSAAAWQDLIHQQLPQTSTAVANTPQTQGRFRWQNTFA